MANCRKKRRKRTGKQQNDMNSIVVVVCSSMFRCLLILFVYKHSRIERWMHNRTNRVLAQRQYTIHHWGRRFCISSPCMIRICGDRNGSIWAPDIRYSHADTVSVDAQSLAKLAVLKKETPLVPCFSFSSIFERIIVGRCSRIEPFVLMFIAHASACIWFFFLQNAAWSNCSISAVRMVIIFMHLLLLSYYLSSKTPRTCTCLSMIYYINWYLLGEY